MTIVPRCHSTLISLALLLLPCILLAGCGGDSASESPGSSEETSGPVAPAEPLNVLIVDDTRLGPVITRQYSARTNGSVRVTDVTWDDLSASDFSAVGKNDIVVYPAGRIGELTNRELIQSLQPEDLGNTDGRRSVFYFDRQQLVTWGDELLGVSLGQSLPVMLVRDDVLAATAATVPETWSDFSELVEKLAASETGDLPTRVGIPLSGHWASYMLLARAAPAVRSPGKYSALFDVGDMKPLIASEPFLRALQGWAREVQPGDGPGLPSDVLRQFMAGELAVAITPINPRLMNELPAADFGFQLAPVPGSFELYDQSSGSWKPRSENDSPLVPLNGSNAMMASVIAASSRSRVAAEFLGWLQDKQISGILAIETANAGPSQKTHLANPAKWLGEGFSAANAAAYAEYVQSVNNGRLCLTILRIPGSDRYLDVLDDAMRNVIADQANAVEALAAVAQSWDNLNTEIGTDQQRAAYRKSEGLQE